jgi:hypothetical protein
MRRSRRQDEFEVRGVPDRLRAYRVTPSPALEHNQPADDELMKRAVTLLAFMRRNEPREKLERLLSPNDPQRGRQAVDALIKAALATEDDRGRLRRNH